MTEVKRCADVVFVEATARNVAKFLRPFIKNIENHYDWDFKIDHAKDLLGYDFQAEKNSYERTIKLKELLVAAIQDSENYEACFEFGKYFVENWGGVSTNKKLEEKLKPFYLEKNKSLNALSLIKTLKGVSTWSKFLSLLNSDAAIYDSRVAYSLNAINFMAGDTDCFFPMPKGRSPRLGIVDIETLFVIKNLSVGNDFITEEDFQHRHMASRLKKKYRVKETLAYHWYLEVLARAAEKLNLEEIEKVKIEMLLFAFAPNKVLEDLLATLEKDS